MQKVKVAKKVQKRERREVLQREAQKTEKASEQAAHRLAGMRSRGESAHKDRPRHQTPPAAPTPIPAPAVSCHLVEIRLYAHLYPSCLLFLSCDEWYMDALVRHPALWTLYLYL